jgi:hypothetical protein
MKNAKLAQDATCPRDYATPISLPTVQLTPAGNAHCTPTQRLLCEGLPQLPLLMLLLLPLLLLLKTATTK